MPVGALLAVVADARWPTPTSTRSSRSSSESSRPGGRKRKEKGPEPQTVDAGGRRIRYLKIGDADGPPVFFVHGFGGDLNNWLFNQAALAERRTTYAIDLPGHGGSTKEVGEGDVGSLTAARSATCWMRSRSRAPIWSATAWAAPSASTWRSNHPDRWPRRPWSARPGSARRSRWSISTAS